MRVAITLTHKTATITSATPKAIKALTSHLSFYPKGYRFAPAFKCGGWDGRIKFVNKGRTIPAGLFRAERKAMNEVGLFFSVKHKRTKIKNPGAGVENDPRTHDPKYAYQGECVDAMVNAVSDGGGIILMLTGGGKTAIAARFAARLNKAYSVLFIVDQVNLLYQAQKEIADWLKEPVGIVGDSEFKPERVTVATIQTLHAHSRLPTRAKLKTSKQTRREAIKCVNDFRMWMVKCSVMIIDELHTQMAMRNFKVIELANPIAVYGLTGTLKLKLKHVRLKATAVAGPVIFEFPMEEGVKAGVVTKATVLQLLFNRRKERQGDGYAKEYPYQTYRHPVKRAALHAIVRYLVRDRGKYVLLLCERVTHLWNLYEAFNDVPHGVACGDVEQHRRLKYQRDFEAGKIRLMIANKVFTKGVNLKRVDVEIDLAEFRDTDAARQKLGRGVRLHIAKNHLLYIDFATLYQTGDSLKKNRNNGSRFARAGKARASAFKKDGTKVIKVNVASADEALQAVIKILKKVGKAA